MKAVSAFSKPRERILATANDLFRKHGLRGIGVDAIAEAAGTNKMTLYRHFGSKDDLVVCCLESVAAESDELWGRLRQQHPGDPKAQLYGWLRHGSSCGGSDGRGCSIANAAIELTDRDHPARKVISDFKRGQRDHLAGICRAAGIPAAEALADALSLLQEGALSARQSMGPDGLSASFVSAGEAVIASFAGGRSDAPVKQTG